MSGQAGGSGLPAGSGSGGRGGSQGGRKRSAEEMREGGDMVPVVGPLGRDGGAEQDPMGKRPAVFGRREPGEVPAVDRQVGEHQEQQGALPPGFQIREVGFQIREGGNIAVGGQGGVKQRQQQQQHGGASGGRQLQQQQGQGILPPGFKARRQGGPVVEQGQRNEQGGSDATRMEVQEITDESITVYLNLM